jgi:hypothetical protein
MCGGITCDFARIFFADIADGTANFVASDTAFAIFFTSAVFADLIGVAAIGNAIDWIITTRFCFSANGGAMPEFGVANRVVLAANGITSRDIVIADGIADLFDPIACGAFFAACIAARCGTRFALAFDADI